MCNNKGTNILDILLNNEDKDELKIEVYLNKIDYNSKISVEFKIGLKKTSSNKLNIIKDIRQFLVYYENHIPLKYSKDFIFDINKQFFSSKDLALINYIYELLEIDGSKFKHIKPKDRTIDGKYIYPPKYLMKEFFNTIKDHRVYFNDNFFSRPVDCEIQTGNPYLEMNLEYKNNEYILKLLSDLPLTLNDNFNIMINGTTILLPTKDFINKIKPYYEIFSNHTKVIFPKEEENRILKQLIPTLNSLSDNLILSSNIQEKVVLAKPLFNFYFDKEDNFILMTLKVQYDKYEFNIFNEYDQKVIYRDYNKESQVISLLNSLGFDHVNGKFYLTFGDNYIFNFFKNKIYDLQNIGTVYYSENFKGIKVINNKSIIGHISVGKYDYFELKFEIKDIPQFEINNILRAFRDNLKYYKLENGEFLDLEELELNNFLKLIDNLNSDNIIEHNTIEFHKSKGLYTNDFIKENKIKFLKGVNNLKSLKSQFNNIDKLTFEVPKEFVGELRNYQYKGYCYLKTLSQLGFGGILADEMGLGKTIQTIAFLSSYKCKTSLIVAPSSLVFNWKQEFSKFAPSLNVALVNSTKEYRSKIINNANNYDVLITTYSLLRNDINEYANIEFETIILDEAQNIKNYNSQNAISVKMLNAKNRFALTGTPIENSLLELWSIFDFIMPGYLFDRDTFIVKYYRRYLDCKELSDEFKKLIKPFILRRIKSDVLKELPSKIEKIIEIELPKEQQDVYGVYTNTVIDLIEKKIVNDEFSSRKIEILSYITKLRQIVLDPSVVLDNYHGGSGKIDALIDILNVAVEENHKILVFSQFTSVLSSIKKRLEVENLTYCYLDGSLSQKKRDEEVFKFNNSDSSIFLISLKAGGVGLNLQSADIVIHFDPWWNPAIEAQASDRAHRIGQKKIVEVIKLIAKDTIEEKVIKLQNEKKELINNILDDKSLKNNHIFDLSEDEILNLFK
ncbi:DEAD/DEAH box helicase [uncultured Clostridium sp.]|uniref:DEAD/DEAH box helicase n=1 Tax=uncultured Clostridium sp. TaxID=59620 RepID=UPI000821C85A|nr:SNF2 helicase associated domain-containing protein [uncultured Clostridium sp.]SCJ18164.1 ATP-dependent helicase HepA [uncultured Clostridium sp.]